MKRRLSRMIRGSGRLIRPPFVAVAAVMVTIAGFAAVAFVAHGWATNVEDPAATLAGAAVLLERPLRLDAARDVAWQYALDNTRDRDDAWRDLLEPPLPPALCGLTTVGATNGGPAAASGLSAADPDSRVVDALATLDQHVRALDQLISRGATVGEIEEGIEALRTAGPFVERGRAEFIARYNLARAYLFTGDFAASAELIEPAFEAYLNESALPIVGASSAARLIERGSVGRRIAIDAFHARFLAGAVAYARQETASAVMHFRFAINAVNYLTANTSDLDAPASFERVSVAPGGACSAGRGDQMLTSLDAYAGLVAAYMAASEFRDPTRLANEVRRTRFEIDADDPFQPVLRYARSVVASRRADGSAIPENLIWAASNLQRVYHYNRLAPDARLEVTRAALLLELTADPVALEALTEAAGFSACDMLGTVAAQLANGASVRAVGRATGTPVDSARAAAALLTYARLESDCEGAPQVAPDVQSIWLAEGLSSQRDPLAARFENWRAELESTVRTGADEGVLRAHVSDLLGAVDADARRFRSGRLPNDLPVGVSTHAAAGLASAWRRSVFEDVAVALAAAMVGDGRVVAARDMVPLAAQQLPAGRAARFLELLDAAIVHAGRRPDDFYQVTELASVARAGGLGSYLTYRVRYAARSEPAAAGALIATAFLLLSFAALVVHVNVWRFLLITRSRMYAAEAERRGAWPSS